MMIITRLKALSDRYAEELLLLMKELNPEIYVDVDMLRRVVSSTNSILFAMIDDGRIIGTATLCILDSPTGRKAHVEDVVVLSSFRGQHLGRRLMEHVIDYARTEIGTVDMYLTSRPQRVVANNLYKALGFRLKETNVYKLEIGSR